MPFIDLWGDVPSVEPDRWLQMLSEPVAPPSTDHRQRAEKRQATLTKPAGSLGRIEQLAIELAALQATDAPSAKHVPIIVFAGDHGIAARAVSAYPQSVTVQMLDNFASGGAAISVLSRALAVPLFVVDAGTLHHPEIPGVVSDKPRCGTRDLSIEPAMTYVEAQQAVGAGQRALIAANSRPCDLVILGEMGIGNTTSAATMAAGLLQLPADDVTGAGTGIDDERLAMKTRLVDAALALHRTQSGPSPAMHWLCATGGFEIAALIGAILEAAKRRIPILIDGFIVSVAALAAADINPSIRPWLLFSHQSVEPGHRAVLNALDAKPLLDLGMRLGEGSGAAIALPMIRLACALHNKMATFADASVSDRLDQPVPQT